MFDTLQHTIKFHIANIYLQISFNKFEQLDKTLTPGHLRPDYMNPVLLFLSTWMAMVRTWQLVLFPRKRLSLYWNGTSCQPLTSLKHNLFPDGNMLYIHCVMWPTCHHLVSMVVADGLASIRCQAIINQHDGVDKKALAAIPTAYFKLC